MAMTDLKVSGDLRKLIAQGLGTDDLHVANKIVERDKTTGKIHDYDMLTRAHFAVMRPNEREVFYLLAEGTSVEEIAGILGIDQTAAEFYRATVYRKMDVASILDLTLLGSILGLAHSADAARIDTHNARAA